MRRVIDDTNYQAFADKIMAVVNEIDPRDVVCDYDRVSESQVARVVENTVPNLMFGKCEHAHGIGNNNAYEIIDTSCHDEQRICGYFHANADMFGGVYCYCTDYDENRKTPSRFMRAKPIIVD